MRHLKTALFLACCALPACASVDPALLSLVPADTKVLVGIDTQSTGNSQLAQVFMKHAGADEKLQEFMHQTGFDPRRDLIYVLIASSAGGSSAPNVVLARGSFDVDRLGQAAVAKGGKARTVAGVPFIEFPGDEQSSVAFPASGVLVAGPANLVTSIIINRDTPTTPDPALVRLMSSVDGHDVWFASTAPFNSFPANFKGQAHGMQQGQVLQSILQESAAIQLGSQVELSFNAVTRSPKDAAALSDVVRFFVDMAQQSKPQGNPQITPLVSILSGNLQINVNGANVQIASTVPEQAIEQILASPKNY